MSVRRLLLIDDDRLQHDLIQGFVAQFRTPWELDTATDYASGLKKMLSDKHAVCLLNSRLGERDGLQLLREARAAGAHVPAILLTAEASDEIDDAAMDAGALDYLVKGEITARILEHSIRYARKLGDTLDQLRKAATRDPLTGMLNRREFDRILLEEWQRSARFGHSFALVMVDIDHFKKINDTYGHQIGDEVLKHVASLLGGQLRSVDRIARYGGEEFGVVMVETDRKQAMEVMQRIRALLAETPCITVKTEQVIDVTLSGGVALMPEDGDSPEQLVAAADKALYAAKHAGRNRILAASRPRQKAS